MAGEVLARITMPIVLTRELSPNGRAGWRVKAGMTKRAREEARRATVSHVNGGTPGVAALVGCTDPVVMDVEVEWPKGRKALDDDNCKASLKAVIDGISDALWGGSDSHVRVGTVAQVRGEGGLAFTFRSDEGPA